MAESVDALVSNTSGAIHPGSIPGLGTKKFLESIFLSRNFCLCGQVLTTVKNSSYRYNHYATRKQRNCYLQILRLMVQSSKIKEAM